MKALISVCAGLGLFLFTPLAAAPPRTGEMKQYREDGTYQTRAEFMRSMGNDRFSDELVAQAKFKLQRLTLEAQGVDPASLGDAGLAPPPNWRGMPTTGTNKVLCLLVEFSDIVHEPANTQAMIHQNIFGSGQAANAPYDSLTNYYKRASYNKLTLTGNTLGWYRTAYPRSQVQQTTTGRESLLKEVLNYYSGQGHDFSQYDNDGDGDVDLFYVIYAGADTGWGNFWWAYQTSFSDQNFRIDGKRLAKYVFQFQNYNIANPFTPLVIIHETGHALGLPDYYDYDNNTGPRGGVGGLDMMDGNRGDHSCFSKWVLGWLTPTVVSAGSSTVTLRASGTSEDCVMVMPAATTAGQFGEYFMLQNRTKTGNDNASDWPGTGLMVWHIDGTLNASGNDYLYNNSYTAHKMIRLMEADGLEEIEAGSGGDAADYYTAGKSFTVSSTPNSRRYDGTDSKVSITNISTAGATMTALVTITGTGTPPNVSLTAPANNSSFPSGTTVSIAATATDDGSVASVAFYVDGAILSTDSSSPYAASWSGGAVGAHVLSAVATDNTGLTRASEGVNVTITSVGGTGPPNDSFAARSPVSGNTATVTGSNANATAEAGEPSHFGRTPVASVWWKWTPSISGLATVTTAGSSFDTILAAYSGSSLAALAALASNDDTGGLRTSAVTFSVTAGVEIKLAVDGYNGATGSVTLNASVTASGLANDAFAGAALIAGSPARVVSAGTNAGATAQGGEPAHLTGNAPVASVWWKWTAPGSGSLEVSTQGSGFDTLLAVYTGTAVNALTQRGANDDYFTDRTSWLTVPVTAGVSYFIAVDGYKGATGAITLTTNFVGSTQPPVVNFIHPVHRQSFATGEVVTLSAEASDPDGTVAEVRFFADGALLGTLPSIPSNIVYSLDWTASAGTHTLTATAVDTGGASSSQSITVHVSTISLEEALDTYDLVWTTGGSAPWFGTDAVSQDGWSSGTNGAIGDSSVSWCATRLTGPGILRYQWAVSSELDYDFLTFYYDGVAQAGAISGYVDWAEDAWTIPAGVHEVKWEYSKDEAVSELADSAWLDRVEWITPPEITTNGPLAAPTGAAFSLTLETLNGDATSYSVAAGTLPPGLALTPNDGIVSGTPTAAGTYAVTFSATNEAGSGTRVILFNIINALSLPVAADTTGITWSSAGSAQWFGQSITSHDAVDAIQSGNITDDQASHAEISVTGPATLSFWWKVDSEADYDFLRFLVDGVEQSAVSGSSGWVQVSHILAAGAHTIRWTYAKDGSVSSGTDAAWVDQVSRTAAGPYLTWTQSKGLAGANAGPTADPDNDGLLNLVEYAIGSEPASGFPDAAALSSSHNAATKRLSLIFRRSPSQTDVIMEVQASSNLSTWTAIARSTSGAATVNLGGAQSVTETGAGPTRAVTVVDGTAGGPGTPKRWLRLKVILQ